MVGRLIVEAYGVIADADNKSRRCQSVSERRETHKTVQGCPSKSTSYHQTTLPFRVECSARSGNGQHLRAGAGTPSPSSVYHGMRGRLTPASFHLPARPTPSFSTAPPRCSRLTIDPTCSRITERRIESPASKLLAVITRPTMSSVLSSSPAAVLSRPRQSRDSSLPAK